MSKQNILNNRRMQRNRTRIRSLANGRLRLSVFRSSKHIYAQVIDDSRGATLVAASSLDKDFTDSRGTTVSAAVEVGKIIAERALKAGVRDVVFDRGRYLYHGRVKALAEGARDGGLNF